MCLCPSSVGVCVKRFCTYLSECVALTIPSCRCLVEYLRKAIYHELEDFFEKKALLISLTKSKFCVTQNYYSCLQLKWRKSSSAWLNRKTVIYLSILPQRIGKNSSRSLPRLSEEFRDVLNKYGVEVRSH